MADERPPVKSPLTELMGHIEMAGYAEGVDPGTMERICNRLLFGHPAGSAAYEAGGPQRYEVTAERAIVDALGQLAARPGLNAFELAAIRRVRHILAGGDPDPPDPGDGTYPVAGYSGAI